jgi:transcriptional repressor NrdR
MRCPFCGFPDSKVVDSRDVDESIRRRRECLNPDCAGRFTTYERVQAVALSVLKKDSRREEFSREKILAGVRTACEKRPLAPAAIEKLVDDIEDVLYKANEPEVPSRVIGEMVMERLRALDAIAYVRFASVYRQFTDIAELQEELAALQTTARPPEAQLPLSGPEFSATTPRLHPRAPAGAPTTRTRTRRPVRPAQAPVELRAAPAGGEKREAGNGRREVRRKASNE